MVNIICVYSFFFNSELLWQPWSNFIKGRLGLTLGTLSMSLGRLVYEARKSRDYRQKLNGSVKTWESRKFFFKVLMTWKDDGIEEHGLFVEPSFLTTLLQLCGLSWHYRHRKLSLSCCFLYNLHSSLSLCTNDWNKVSLIIRLWLFIIA